jgi:hypothetical protein
MEALPAGRKVREALGQENEATGQLLKVFDPSEKMGEPSSSRDWRILVFQGRTVA